MIRYNSHSKYFVIFYFYSRNKYCSPITQECHKKTFKRKPKDFHEECDGDYQCKNSFNCVPREVQRGWNRPKGWCDTKGTEGAPCGITKGKKRVVKHHEHCRYSKHSLIINYFTLPNFFKIIVLNFFNNTVYFLLLLDEDFIAAPERKIVEVIQ